MVPFRRPIPGVNVGVDVDEMVAEGVGLKVGVKVGAGVVIGVEIVGVVVGVDVGEIEDPRLSFASPESTLPESVDFSAFFTGKSEETFVDL